MNIDITLKFKSGWCGNLYTNIDPASEPENLTISRYGYEENQVYTIEGLYTFSDAYPNSLVVVCFHTEGLPEYLAEKIAEKLPSYEYAETHTGLITFDPYYEDVIIGFKRNMLNDLYDYAFDYLDEFIEDLAEKG